MYQLGAGQRDARESDRVILIHRRMKSIVFITAVDVSQTSGAGIATRELIRALGECSDTHLHIICPSPKKPIPNRIKGSIYEFKFLPSTVDSGTLTWHLKVELAILRYTLDILQNSDPDTVITRLSPSTLAPAPLCRMFGISHILLIRGWVTSHAYNKRKYRRIISRVAQMNIRLSNSVFVAFDELRKWASKYRSPQQTPIEVLPNGVDPDLFYHRSKKSARNTLDLSQDDFIIGFVGNLAGRHELPTLLEAITKVDDVQLVIVGGGETQSNLRKLCRTFGIEDRVQFTGRVDHDDIPNYVAAFDVGYGVISEEKPSNPIKCYEYLACECPVLSSWSQEMAFIDEVNAGYLVDAVTPESIADTIQTFREIGNHERTLMGRRGRQYVVEHATWRRLAQKIMSSIFHESIE